MKREYFKIISLFIAVLFLAAACEKPPIEKANDAYDWSKVIPKIMEIAGQASVPAHGLAEFPYTYSVPARGGSSWAWTVTTKSGAGTADVVLEESGRVAKINFPQRSETDTAFVTVVETTYHNEVSEPETMKVVLTPFCPYLWADWEGNYTGTSGSHSDPVVLTRTTNLNEFSVQFLASFIQTSWGENWVEGDGTCEGKFDCGDVFIIPNQEIGKSDFPDTYRLEGTGTVNPDTKVITLTYKVFYTGGSTSDITTTLTKQ